MWYSVLVSRLMVMNIVLIMSVVLSIVFMLVFSSVLVRYELSFGYVNMILVSIEFFSRLLYVSVIMVRSGIVMLLNVCC